MNPRENVVSLYRRQGYERAPLGLHLCPALEAEFARRYPEAGGDYLGRPRPRPDDYPGSNVRIGPETAAARA